MAAKTPLLSIRDAARILQRSTKSLRNYVKAGKLAAEKIPGPKGPQFVFQKSEIDRLAEELRLDVAEQVVHRDAPGDAAPGLQLTVGAPPSLAQLVEAYIQADKERTQLHVELAETKAASQHTIGVLEERVTQLHTRLKREERDAQRAHLLERELEKLRKKTVAREQLLRDLQQLRKKAERRHFWQVWRPRFTPTALPEEPTA